MRQALPFLVLCLWATGCAAEPDPHPLRAIPALDLPRYGGHWFELANFPNRFQKKCVGDTTADYSLAAIGEPRRNYLWILSRTPSVDPARYQALLARLREQGYDTARLRTTAQMPER